METKTCKRCGLAKQRAEFHKDSGKKDGLRVLCKLCIKAYQAQPRVMEIKRRAQRRYSKTALGKITEMLHGPKRQERIKALGRDKVYYAVRGAQRNGTLEKQPCETCGDPNTQAHHHDYSRPLDVRWLCHMHHAEEHRNGSFSPKATTATTHSLTH